MKFDILTLFPEYFDSPLKVSIIGRAIDSGLVEVNRINIRDFATKDKNYKEGKRLKVDDSPYGGGAGMVLQVEPIVKAIESVLVEGVRDRTKVVLLTPQGKPFTQGIAKELSEVDNVVLVCGRYEGFDERVREFVDLEVSLGDFVLTGGEAAALAVTDAVARLCPGVVGKDESLSSESFSRDKEETDSALLEYPQYTRPDDFRGLSVPSVLMSGNHKEIDKWRRKESFKRTLKRRPELIEKIEKSLSDSDKEILKEIKNKN